MVDFRKKLRSTWQQDDEPLWLHEEDDPRDHGFLCPPDDRVSNQRVGSDPYMIASGSLESVRQLIEADNTPPPRARVTFTAEQEEQMDCILEWAGPDNNGREYALVGLAGTGKTTVLAETVARMRARGIRVLVVAPTGRAALQLRKKGIDATTLHKAAYRLTHVDLESESLVFERKGQIGGAPDVVCCDEASMLELGQLKDLRKLASKILLVGDHGQLPPINGRSALASVRSFSELKTVHRQALDSGIIRFSLAIRSGASVDDALKVGAPDVLWGMPDVIPDIAICARHRERVEIGETMRHFARLAAGNDPYDPSPLRGDRIVALANDDRPGRGWANGMVGSILEVKRRDQYDLPAHEGRAVCDDDVDRSFDLFTEILGSMRVPMSKSDVGIRDSFGRPELSHEQRSLLFWWGWALTCHKAQGSEWPLVLVNDRSFGSEEDKRAWRYTAATRAQQHLRWT